MKAIKVILSMIVMLCIYSLPFLFCAIENNSIRMILIFIQIIIAYYIAIKFQKWFDSKLK